MMGKRQNFEIEAHYYVIAVAYRTRVVPQQALSNGQADIEPLQDMEVEVSHLWIALK